MKIFRRRKRGGEGYNGGESVGASESSLNEGSWNNMGDDFDQEAAEENRRRAEAERVEKAREAQISKMKSEIVKKFAQGNTGYFYLEIQNGGINEEQKREFLNEVYVPRPVDSLETSYSRPSLKEEREKKGMSALDWACETRFVTDIGSIETMNERQRHYRRILLDFTGGDFNSPQDANENTYKKFVEKFETVFDFQDVSERFVNSIGVRRSDDSIDRIAIEKKNEYKRDMEEFKWLLFGGQMAVLKAFEELDKEAMDDYQPEVTGTDRADKAEQEKNIRVEDPLVGQDLGGGYRCAVARGFVDSLKVDAYKKEHNLDDGYIAVRYEKTGKWYIATK